MAIVFVAAVATAGAGGAAYATHQLTDVGDGHPFHDEIAQLVDAGITTGYVDGTFRPGEPLTRQAMAAFLIRGLPRIAFASDVVTSSTNGQPVTVVDVEITSPAAGGSGGYVVVDARTTAYALQGVACPCNVSLDVARTTDGEPAYAPRYSTIGAGGELGAVTHLADVAVFPIEPGATERFALRAAFHDADLGDLSLNGRLLATYVPFRQT